MPIVLGIDVGTEGTKALAINSEGEIIAESYSTYRFDTPRSGWTQQNPDVWWQAVRNVLHDIWNRINPHQVVGIGVAGQMHSSVCVDGDGIPVHPSILWNDTRTHPICEHILNNVGAEKYQSETGNSLLPGFTAGKLVWMRNNVYDAYCRIKTVMMPKDYVNFRLTGVRSADVSDASGTGFFNIRTRTWNDEMIEQLEFPRDWFPAVRESSDVIGYVTKSAAEVTGLRPGIPVIAGAGDNAAAAVGLNISEPGQGMISVGTSGVVLCPLDEPPTAEQASKQNPTLHVFCHALSGRWYAMAVTLSAGGSLRWFRDVFEQGASYDDMMAVAASAPPGSDGLVYLPYLTGERTPLNSDKIRAAFIGIDVHHHKSHFTRAVVEGVAYSISDGVSLLSQSVGPMNAVTITGGVVRSRLWLNILRNVLGTPLRVPKASGGASYGVALLAGLGVGVWPNASKMPRAFSLDATEVFPRQELSHLYKDAYQHRSSAISHLLDWSHQSKS
ncbi:xylulokinase [Alicyclobacillus sp. SO9]|uniref:xylulokinase n=1 Tax=Alicyclobacillus sp. SO9 TaxID=2665646 RepID=UPI0018E86046|nr:xylulokinase [Alicyclobacillus sp. SO9]QQE77905.1 xylulokinase [Alicyclobacillus sp. SO9]